jgi:NAD(P)-dependent dehydrogenase (short-subunit alcohol dehydrogenase family)
MQVLGQLMRIAVLKSSEAYEIDEPYTEVAAYGRSKTANILFAVEFDRRHRTNGVRATAVHPGGIQTELGRHMKPGVIQQMINQINEINAANAAAGRPAYSFKTIPQGAATSVCSGIIAAADDVGGRYCEDCHVAELAEDADVSGSVRGGVRAYAVDPDRAKKLWAKSEEMVGERF